MHRKCCAVVNIVFHSLFFFKSVRRRMLVNLLSVTRVPAVARSQEIFLVTVISFFINIFLGYVSAVMNMDKPNIDLSEFIC